MDWSADCARIDGTGIAWAADHNNVQQSLTIDLGEKKNITGIITTGSTLPDFNFYVKTYKIQYSNDGSVWKNYQNAFGVEDKDLQERSQEWDDDIVRSVQFCNKVDDVMTAYKLLFDRKKKQRQQRPITLFLQPRKKEPVPTTTMDTPSETVEEVPQEMAPPSEET
ncbi:DCBD2 protein, partial [Polypterus senegalus]